MRVSLPKVKTTAWVRTPIDAFILAKLEAAGLEPAPAADPATLVRRGATIFLTSHVLEVVERLCDRVAIINEGKLVLEDSMEKLRGSAETLEDAFVRAVGAERTLETLDWL